MATTARTKELNFTALGAGAAILMAVSAFLFFALFNALSSADPRTETAQFLGDAAGKQGLAAAVAWMNAWLGLLTAPLYLGLYFALRHASGSYTLLALCAGLAWGLVLIVATPLMLTLLVYVAPGWAQSTDPGTRSGLAQIGAALGWTINATIGGTVFFLRALSVLAVSRVMFLLGGRFWAGLAWLGLLFAVEHIITGIQRVVVLGSGGAAGSTVLGALGGLLLFAWLIGVGIGLWRLRRTTETTATVGAARLAQTTATPG